MESKRKAVVPTRLSNVRFKTTMHNCVAFKVMLARTWVETFDESDWDIFWCVSMIQQQCLTTRSLAESVWQPYRADVHSLGVDSGFDHSRLLDSQKLNHFPRHYELTRKCVSFCNIGSFRL